MRCWRTLPVTLTPTLLGVSEGWRLSLTAWRPRTGRRISSWQGKCSPYGAPPRSRSGGGGWRHAGLPLSLLSWGPPPPPHRRCHIVLAGLDNAGKATPIRPVRCPHRTPLDGRLPSAFSGKAPHSPSMPPLSSPPAARATSTGWTSHGLTLQDSGGGNRDPGSDGKVRYGGGWPLHSDSGRLHPLPSPRPHLHAHGMPAAGVPPPGLREDWDEEWD